MGAVIHGWRVYSFKRCNSHGGDITLSGQFGMHTHDRESPRATCRGRSGAMWMTPEAKDDAAYTHTGDECPDFSCTCGFYGHRLFHQVDNGSSMWVSSVIAHVTALGKTVLHTDGFRTARYSIDFIVKPRTPEARIMVPLAPHNADSSYAPYGLYWTGIGYEAKKIGPLVDEVVAQLNVPLLEPSSFNACPDCLVANSWQTAEAIEAERRKNRAMRWAQESGGTA